MKVPKNPSEIKLSAVGGFSTHKNPFDLKNSHNELANMLNAVAPSDIPMKRHHDPTIATSNFNTADSKTKVGHKRKPLGDWDVVALEDAKRYQIE